MSGYAVGVVPGKGGFDCLVALALCLLLWPLWLVVALLIRCEDRGPVFFRQVRIGHRGRPFRIWKFRTMRAAAPGAAITVGRDPRITRIGAWLRRSRIDETPQVLNILAGEMSLVGPRPEVPRYVGRDPLHRAVLFRRPGLTDPSSLRYRDEAALLAQARDPEVCYRTRILPDKLRASLAFARGESLSADWRVLVRTAAGWEAA